MKGVMIELETTQVVPLVRTEDGTIRLKNSRLTLDSVLHEYKQGATAEQIADSFPPVSLADIHAVIAYYLTHRAEIEEYLREQERQSDEVQQRIESDPQYKNSRSEMRERLTKRWKERSENQLNS